MKKKKVYVGLAADILHEGHINILKRAHALGEVTVGLLTDQAISSYKRFPHLNYKNREAVLKNLSFVKQIIQQDTLDYEKNLISKNEVIRAIKNKSKLKINLSAPACGLYLYDVKY